MTNDRRDLLPDGFERERRLNFATFWKCLAAFVVLLILTVVAHSRPDWIADVLGGATVLAFIFVLIGAQELWRLRRSNPFK